MQGINVITFVLFVVFGVVALVVGAYLEAPIKNTIEAVIESFSRK